MAKVKPKPSDKAKQHRATLEAAGFTIAPAHSYDDDGTATVLQVENTAAGVSLMVAETNEAELADLVKVFGKK